MRSRRHWVRREISAKREVQNNAYSMHSATREAKQQAHGGFWPVMGSGERKILDSYRFIKRISSLLGVDLIFFSYEK